MVRVKMIGLKDPAKEEFSVKIRAAEIKTTCRAA
jgi:hypothetical protein